MDFFASQDRAKSASRKLVALFIVAVIGVVLSLNIVAYIALRLMESNRSESDRYSDARHGIVHRDPLTRYDVYSAVSIGTLLIIVSGSAYKSLALRGGGASIAQLLGGKPIEPGAADEEQRVLLNVVEEMAIASGVPTPRVFVLENESGINAFAAGKSFDDAVIGVTRGTIRQLSRDQLQGVIAHEFSHILHGDMRLNLRLISLVHGILVIALIGYTILRNIGGGRKSSSKDSKGIIAVLAAAVALLIIGYVGVFFARLIQSAISRQREFLADASAVQFTRNPRGIADALRKIGGRSHGSKLDSADALQVSHMLFASGVASFMASLFATHPPLPERIKAIDPMWDGQMLATEATDGMADLIARATDVTGVSDFSGAMPADVAAMISGFTGGGVHIEPGTVVGSVAKLIPENVRFAGRMLDALPPQVAAAVHEPFSSRAVILLLLLSDNPALRERQIAQLAQIERPLLQEMMRLESTVLGLGADRRLPLVSLAAPALRRLSPPQAAAFDAMMRGLIEADQHVSIAEYAVWSVAAAAMRPAGKRTPRYASISAVAPEIGEVLWALASASSRLTGAAFVAGTSRLQLNLAAPEGDATVARLGAALGKLADATPAVKRRIIDAAAHVVAADELVTIEEAEMLRAVAATLDVPMPPFVPVGDAA